MDITIILVRTVLIYFVVFLVMRFMGKREIGKLTVFDLVISVMIAEIAVLVIEDPNRPILEGILPMIALFLVQVGIAFLTLKSRTLRLWFDGKPSVIIAKGKLNRDTMRKQRYNLDDLMLQLRENKVASVSDVEFAILETSGKLSVVEKDKSSSKDNKSLKDNDREERVIPPKFRYEILPIPLIMDGKVQDENLEKLEKNRFWLKNQLRQQGIRDLKDVFLCTLDHKGKMFVDTKQTPKP
ncbi:YetF domain-containing protein [Paenibacillus abyssi]|uniref:UPF0702 transmembrane protein YrbG n=1 Tax=Paenibacillus abyssi TaxID=1340531 RepID=A0A917G2Y0_9BACL|nr:DUF421 domain-containing protein [Paenibacillus abyssi]GGG20029.1 UPF0702 transmembrane protein YrbG [Paenibacillus abyssi]